jgi:hypothetical protein
MREELADLCHRQWSGWMRYLYSRCVPTNYEGLRIPSVWVSRWYHQIKTPYKKLPDIDMDSDLKEADKFLVLIVKEVKRICTNKGWDKQCIKELVEELRK